MQTDLERRVTRKLMWRIIPFVMLLYRSFYCRFKIGCRFSKSLSSKAFKEIIRSFSALCPQYLA